MSEETSKSLKKSSRRNTENVLLEKNSALNSRTAFIESLGATCKNWQWSWSFVNKEKKFVIFGEWQGRSDRKPGLIFSNDWEIRNGRRNRGFRQGLEHIRLIIEDGFKLFTFPMIANEKDEEDKGRVRIKRFINKVTEKTLLKKEDGWYALPILPESDLQNHDDPTEADGQKAWTKEELTSSIKAYLMMLEMQNTNKLVNKTVIYRTLAAKTGRSSKSIEYRMQNISYVLQLSGRTTVIGLAPARNVGTNVIFPDRRNTCRK